MDKKQDGKDIRNAARILEEYFARHTTPELDEAIQRWLSDEKDAVKKDAAFGELFDRHVEYRQAPSRKTFIMFNKLSRRLGFAPRHRAAIPLGKRVWFRVAAAVLPVMVIGGAVWFALERNAQPVIVADVVTVTTGEGIQRQVILPDSSRIWLNGSSTVTYPADFTADRTVELSGEAYFSVRKAEGSTFSVRAGGITATVLGTEFNIRAYDADDQTEVYLGSGSLAVEAGTKKVTLKPNDVLVKHETTDRLDVMQAPEDFIPQWRSDLVFADTPLLDALGQIGERFGMKIEVLGVLPEDSVSVDFDYSASPETVLSILRNTLMYFSYEIDGDTIRITAGR